MTIKKWLIILIIALLILLGILIWKHSPSAISEPASPATGTSTSTNTLPPGISIIPGTNITLTQPQPQKISTPEPSLNRPIPTNSGLDASAVASLTASLNTAISNLEKNNTSFTDWINLGFYRKALGDYQGAAEAWEYVSLLYPKNSVSFGDLGDLYANFLGDTTKAQVNYQTAIRNNPADLSGYSDLAALYESSHNSAAAVAILKQGVSANPQDFSLLVSLARYDRSIGDTVGASAAYVQAENVANKQNNSLAANEITAEAAQ